VLQRRGFKDLAGLRLGLITNHTGLTASGERNIDLLAKISPNALQAIFSPEHGLSGKAAAGEKVADARDEATGKAIFSLYGNSKRPSAAQLKNVDALVFDMQDIGSRCFTYISTMLEGMKAAAEHGKKFIVLDRINPIGGLTVDGPMLAGPLSFTAIHPMPMRHGMTVGELALLFKKELKLKLDLRVIPVEGWERRAYQDATSVPWRNPSPNMRHLHAAVAYGGTVLLEPTNVSVGRGTAAPFFTFGAPWIEAEVWHRALRLENLTGAQFKPTTFTPTSSTHAGELCQGVTLEVTDAGRLPALRLGVALLATLHRLYAEKFTLAKADQLLVDPATLEGIRTGRDLEAICSAWPETRRSFEKARKAVLLYR
jgi:uncharacterized protein YbbC (DUF1343 family)